MKQLSLIIGLGVLIASALLIGFTAQANSNNSGSTNTMTGDSELTVSSTYGSEVRDMDRREIVLAGGCFWGTEKYFQLLYGVVETEVGYANGTLENPSYQDVTTGQTGFAEAVKITYDNSKISLPFLLDIYFETIDPTAVNRQGNDVGTQYRSGIYYSTPEEKVIAEESLEKLQATTGGKVAIEATALENFYTAEEYHQDYLQKNPNGYCHISKPDFEHAATVRDPTRAGSKPSTEFGSLVTRCCL